MKRKLILIFALVLILVLISTSTAAYFVTDRTALNRITTGRVSVAVHITGANGAEAGPVPIIPGATVDERLTVQNTGRHPAWVRVSVTPTISNAALPLEGCMVINYNRAMWTEKDGWFYYNGELAGGAATESLITSVSFSGPGIDNRYLGAAFNLDIKAEAVQAENNGTTALQAAGWPA